MSDASKDISINAATLAGNLSVSGNTQLGNASSDTITSTASYASHLNPSAHNTYDFGTVTTLGWRAFYFASSSATKTAKVLGPAISSDIILTLPNYTGTLRNIPSVIASQTGTYAILASDEFIPVSASGGAFTATLPTAAGATGKIYTIKRTDQTLANMVTIATTSSQTIDGVTTTTLATQYESIEVISDGSNWHILKRYIDETWYSFTPTGSWSSNVTYTGYWKRLGDSIEVRSVITCSGAPTSANLTINIPSGLTMDTTKLIQGANSMATIGHGTARDAGSNSYRVYTRYIGTNTLYQVVAEQTDATFNTSSIVTQLVPFTFGSTDTVEVISTFPVTNWKG